MKGAFQFIVQNGTPRRYTGFADAMDSCIHDSAEKSGFRKIGFFLEIVYPCIHSSLITYSLQEISHFTDFLRVRKFRPAA